VRGDAFEHLHDALDHRALGDVIEGKPPRPFVDLAPAGKNLVVKGARLKS
jgi:hypothetical protein